MDNKIKLSILLIVISFITGAFFYTQFPALVATHWNLSGQSNGFMPKIVGTFLLPIMMAILLVFLYYLPKLDPLRANIESFKTQYYQFILVFLSFLFLVYIQTILWNLGTQINFRLTLPILLGALFFCLGMLLDKTKRNWYIGIRTPWTLYSDEVWDKTHKLGAKIFKAAGVLMVLTIIFPASVFLLVILLAIVSALACVIYSYLVYSNIKKK